MILELWDWHLTLNTGINCENKNQQIMVKSINKFRKLSMTVIDQES